MPSPEHEAIVDLCRSNPSLIVELMSGAMGVKLPPETPLDMSESTFSSVSSVDFHADLFVRLPESLDPAIPNLIVEVQVDVDDDKLLSWPVYQAMARREHGRLTSVLVVTPSARVAAWARRVIPTGLGKSACEVFAAGPREVPRIEDPEEARRLPAVAVLSAMTHAEEPDALEIAKCGLLALETGQLRAETQQILYDVIWSKLDPAVHRALEAYVNQSPHEYKSERVRRFVAEGREEGLAAGRTKGLIEALLVTLRGRHIGLSAAQRATIESCTDLDQIHRWLERAASATSPDALFDG